MPRRLDVGNGDPQPCVVAKALTATQPDLLRNVLELLGVPDPTALTLGM